ncbi:MAG: chemotaxis protein CheW [Gammaproteobacteria bacterium]|nr:chemotaxis protein CheW [Gammaproteobacteria bacterium]MDH5630690.1 chemotaxis protein CheW [Gammaproteobacteria bacterium]
MAESANLQAFEFLESIEKRSIESASFSAREEDLSRYWTGIGFKLSDIEYIVRLEDVAEIISIPRYTKVPGAKSWVKGLANIRGSLLPIMDLHGFLGRTAGTNARRQRLLVVNKDDVHCGVIVDEIMGLNHFEKEEWVEDVPIADESITPYVKGGFYSGTRLWTVFSMSSLVDTQAFRQIALV